MERGSKKHRGEKSVSFLGLGDWIPIREKPVYPLNLGDWIPQKDVRKLIWNKLNNIDKLMIWAAHGVNKYMKQDARLYVPFCVQYGYLDLTLFFLTEKKDAVSYFIRHGGYHGYLNMIEWVFINFPEEFDGNIISRNAACGGHIKILEYIEKLGKPLCEYLSLYGARHNHTNVIKWAKERGQTIWWSCLYFFVLNRNMELINLYLNESDAPLITSDCFLKACENDDLEILKLLYNKNRANYHKQICLEQVLEGSEIENWIINNTLDFYFVWHSFFFVCSGNRRVPHRLSHHHSQSPYFPKRITRMTFPRCLLFTPL